MSEHDQSAASQGRFSLEYPGLDFPFYRGQPVFVSRRQWTFVLAMVVLGFAVLIVPVPFFQSGIGRFVPVILFPVIPLAGLAHVAPGHWQCLFRRPGGRDLFWMLAFTVLGFLAALPIAVAVLVFYGANANAVVEGLAAATTSDQISFFLRTLPQLLGEEVITILPFLALLQWSHTTLAMSRRQSILLAWLVSSVLFGLIHLPAYDWNLVQCLLVIGTARLILTLAYIKTKNIWVSTGAHVLYDWASFVLIILLSDIPV